MGAPDFREELRARLESRRPRLLELARELSGDKWSDTDLAQLLRGFETLLGEALVGESTDARTLFVETAVPAGVAAGETTTSVAASTAAWAVLLTTELVAELPPEQRREAGLWLADFFESYARDVIEAVLEAERA